MRTRDATAQAGWPVEAPAIPELVRGTDGLRVDGREPVRVVTTHVSSLAFTEELVVKTKRPVSLGFVDFTTLGARQRACAREIELNRRICDDVYLGVADVLDESGEVVDAAVVMRRLPAQSRLESRLALDMGVGECVRSVARQLAVFHAGQPPQFDVQAIAGVAALEENWSDNLEVIERARIVDEDVLAAVREDQTSYLIGRRRLIDSRIDAGLVRDGHGDLMADDIFCLPDGPRIVDCLEFADRYRIGDVLLDAAFLAMQLEYLGHPDLSRQFIRDYVEFSNEHHPASLAHHFMAYRASVRAKVAAIEAEQGKETAPSDASKLIQLARRHLEEGRVRLILVGGLPGTGKSTLSEALADDRGFTVLRTDELRKDLVGVPHMQPAPKSAYDRLVTVATYAELLDRADALLRRGESVILDATWSSDELRSVARATAASTASELIELRCVASDRAIRERLMRRRNDVSDADMGVYEQMRRSFEAWPAAAPIPTGAGDPALGIALEHMS